MKSQVLARVAGCALAAVIAFAAYGCSKKAGLHNFYPNQRPTVMLTSGPIDARDTVSFSIVLRWSADDPDGRVDYYEYAVDPKDNDTVWTRTTDNKLEERFSSRDPLPKPAAGVDRKSVQTHTFVIKAFDNLGLASVPKTRSFTSSTISPTVRITSPIGSDLGYISLPPTTHIEWSGDDPDGVTSRKPTYYMWKLFKFGNTEFEYNLIKSQPDSLRRFYAKTNFSTWDTVPGPRGANSFIDLPTERSPNLELGMSYLFVVVAFDTAKAYSPAFSFAAGGNILEFNVGFAGNLGPPITAFNDFFFYRMISGGFTPGKPESYVPLEFPAALPVTFNWTVTGGSRIRWFRWKLNKAVLDDVFDETPRTNEATDWYHWSAQGAGTTSCRIGPFPPNPAVKPLLYIEAMDTNGLLSLLTIELNPVQPTFSENLLIVDDCRNEVDHPNSAGQTLYTQLWPSAAELDTFLYARGGVPWRGTQVPPSAAVQPLSPRGLFAGYSFDTLGTRLGLQIASSGVPLSKLGQYRHVIWMVDKNGGANINSPLDLAKPMSTLHWMCTPNHMNTLGSYMTAGGRVWLLGGDAAFASLREFDAKLSANNNAKYGPGFVIFSSLSPAFELAPGRLLYSGAHWQSEMAVQVVNLSATFVRKSNRVPSQPWSSPGWNFSRPTTNPNYSRLPASMRPKLLSRGDSLPPTRTNSSQFYGATTFDVEYLTQPNEIIEDIDPNPFLVTEVPALDTLMSAIGFSLAPTGNEAATMTYYHGVTSPEFVFSGFNIWMWTRADCKQLVDFVLQEIWKMPAPSPAPAPAPQSALGLGVQSPATARPVAAPAGAWSRLPSPRTGGR